MELIEEYKSLIHFETLNVSDTADGQPLHFLLPFFMSSFIPFFLFLYFVPIFFSLIPSFLLILFYFFHVSFFLPSWFFLSFFLFHFIPSSSFFPFLIVGITWMNFWWRIISSFRPSFVAIFLPLCVPFLSFFIPFFISFVSPFLYYFCLHSFHYFFLSSFLSYFFCFTLSLISDFLPFTTSFFFFLVSFLRFILSVLILSSFLSLSFFPICLFDSFASFLCSLIYSFLSWSLYFLFCPLLLFHSHHSSLYLLLATTCIVFWKRIITHFLSFCVLFFLPFFHLSFFLFNRSCFFSVLPFWCFLYSFFYVFLRYSHHSSHLFTVAITSINPLNSFSPHVVLESYSN